MTAKYFFLYIQKKKGSSIKEFSMCFFKSKEARKAKEVVDWLKNRILFAALI